MSAWHLDQELADRYAGGAVPPVLAASVEQHLVVCGDCRTLIRVDGPRLDAVWTEIAERVEAPRVRLLERGLRRLGVSGPTAHLVAATPVLRGATVTGGLVLLLLSVLAAHASPRDTAIFVSLAPVLPVLGVAVAFGPRTDPTLDVAAASPYSLVRLLIVRTAFVVGATMLPAAGLALLLPASPWLTIGWLLPSLAMCAVVLASATRVEPTLSASALAAGWLVLTAWLRAAGSPLLTSHGTTVQLLSLVTLVAACWHLATHRNDLAPHRRAA